MFFFDTNILIYAVDETHPGKTATSRNLLGDVQRARWGYISFQVLSEFASVVMRKRMRSTEMCVRLVRDFAHKLLVVPTNETAVIESIELAGTHRLSFWDAMILQSAINGGCKYLLTEDFSPGTVMKVGGASVEIINPFTHQARVQELLTIA